MNKNIKKSKRRKRLIQIICLILILRIFCHYRFYDSIYRQIGSQLDKSGYSVELPDKPFFTKAFAKAHRIPNSLDEHSSAYLAYLSDEKGKEWEKFLKSLPESVFSAQGFYNHFVKNHGSLDNEFLEQMFSRIKNENYNFPGFVCERYIYASVYGSPEIAYHLVLYDDGNKLYMRFIGMHY